MDGLGSLKSREQLSHALIANATTGMNQNKPSQPNNSLGYLINHLPKTRDGIPEGLCHYELLKRLGIKSRKVMWAWCRNTDYKPIDGRSKYSAAASSQRVRKHPEEHYRKVLEASATTKTLEELSKELGITREGVRLAYKRLGISRVKQRAKPNSFAKLKEKIMRV